MTQGPETQLYAPIKAYFEEMGYEVKSEVGAADVVAVRDGEEPVIIELKTGFSLTLLQQGIARQAVSDAVYVCVPRWQGKAGWRAFKGNLGLCRRLGLGVITVRLEDGVVEVHDHPREFRPRKSKVKLDRLMAEFAARAGDPNVGGMRGGRMTAYRQDAIRCAEFLRDSGASRGAEVARATGVGRATRIMADNHYGWFERVARGVYGLAEGAVMPQGENDTV